MGNICRSPTAEAVMKRSAEEAGLVHRLEVDSAGTADFHIGELPDRRARAEARRRGLELASRARQVHVGDFEYFDLMVAMDELNAALLRDLAPDTAAAAKVRLLMDFAEDGAGSPDVPDPYLGGAEDFSHVFELVEGACGGLLDHLRAVHDLRP